MNNNSDKKFAVLIDPEKCYGQRLEAFVKMIDRAKPDFVFVGGSQLKQSVDEAVTTIKENTDIRVILFPGNSMQISDKADAILFLSLISGRNPDFLTGHHINSAKMVKQSGLEVIPTGYILVNGGKHSAVEKVSGTKPLSNIDEIESTAIAGELLGNKLIYLEAGSGAIQPVDKEIIGRVKQSITVPLIVGGGLKSKTDIQTALSAGANIIVVGNHLETYPEKIFEFVQSVRDYTDKFKDQTQGNLPV
ncbi:MAG: geranylgeranylglyceryl/heptaprenylglyceryl phosphate synthase [Prevotellaceae bacterium]|nr:geranylgeranylglyceryl/heptaprenylglyceryl phosphate synthase [Prevotellaceae bacterium]